MTPNELKIMETGFVENDSINIELNESIKTKYGLNIVYSYYCCMKACEAVISDGSISKEAKIKLLIESFDVARNYDKLNLLTRNN